MKKTIVGEMKDARRKNKEIIANNKLELKKLEQFYVDGKVEGLSNAIKELKEEKVKEIREFSEKYDKRINPLIITNYFFKSVNPLGSKTPLYSPEQLAIFFDYYTFLVTQVNANIGDYLPTLTGFCKFIGISTGVLRNLKNSSDADMREIVNKIYDEIGEENLMFSQMGYTKERSTLFRLKAEHEMVEKVQPNVNITYKEVINTDKIDSKLAKYKELLDKKDK